MIQLFDIKEKKVVPHSNTYLIPELKIIIDKFPNEYLKVLQYIAFMTLPDGSNPYIQVPEDSREKVILLDISPYNFSIDNEYIQKAIEKCEFLFETPSLRIVQGAKQMLDEMARNLSKPLTFGKDGNATDMRGIMKEIRGYRQDYVEMENALKEEQSKVRGGLHLRYDQQPTYKNLKSDEDDE